ncbi:MULTISPECIES: glycosyltransferase family 25 protein [Parabacteroides]|nr:MULTISPECIES: glycosyltransferase family 25 protein [Parabacteroides]MCA5585455.1 glycosyltransferase family 25 protein [Parabacteroides gordonii]
MDTVMEASDMKKSTIKTYLINLKESVERRERVLRETAGHRLLDIELVEAVDGRKMSAEEVTSRFHTLKFIYRYERTPKRGEIGCTLSHRECYRRFLESDNEFALILEDDVTFLYPVEETEEILQQLTAKLSRRKSHLITLSIQYIYYPGNSFQINSFSVFKVSDAWGTCAYLINRKAAKKLLSVSRASIVADDFVYMNCHGIRVDGIYPNLAAGASSMKQIDTEIQDNSICQLPRKDLPFRYMARNFLLQKYWGLLLFFRVLAFRKIGLGRNE